jgi:peptide deformylase
MSVDVAGLRILRYPHPALRTPGRPVGEIDQDVRAVAARMLALMHEAEGAGLAAPQVGLAWRLFVTGARDGRPDLVYVNPRLTQLGGAMQVRTEGCLSLPGIDVEIRRPASAAITALDLEGREFSLSDEEMLARVWQHEIDHLDGILIIDRMSTLDRIATRRVLRELEAGARLL